MTPASAKSKGRKLQQWTRDAILARYPELNSDDVRSTPMGVTGEDVQLSQQARRMLPVQIQCKNRRRMAIYADFNEAKSHGKHIPVLVVKQDYSNPLAVVDAEWFFDLLRKLNGNL